MLTLRTLTLSLLLTIVVASVGSGLALDKLYSELYSSEQTNKGLTQTQLNVIGAQLSAILRRLENKEEFIRAWQEENSPLSLEIIDRDDIRIPAELLQELENTGHIVLSSATNLSYYSFLKEDGNYPYTGGYLVIRSPLTSNHKQPNWLPILFTIIFYTLLLLIMFAWLSPLIRRLQTMQSSAKKLGEGNLSARITPSVVSHIKDIEIEFNRMAQRIEELVSDISLLSSAISHEMRAPLAKLQFGLDALREEDDEEKRKVYEDRLDKVITDMTNLVETLLKYARLDKNIIQLPKDEVDLLELCTSLITPVAKPNNGEGKLQTLQIDIAINAKEPFYIVKGDVFYLNLLVENLLSNAIKYGRGKILVSLHQQENGILLSIEDNGPGIEENFKQDIFKPFMRGEKNKNEVGIQGVSPKGYGLGMALVKRIADLHNVEITITTSAVLGGAKFTLLFA
ncbi:MAG: ATP-binding protein [Pseudomonadota bacterium]